MCRPTRLAPIPAPPRKDTVNSIAFRAPIAPVTTSLPADPTTTRRFPEPSGLTADEIRQIILDLLG